MKKNRWSGLVIAIISMIAIIGFMQTKACAAGVTKEITVKVGATASEIQDALDMNKNNAYSGGLTVKLPKGTYWLERTLTIYSNTTLECDANAKLVRKYSQASRMLGNYREEGGAPGYSGASNIKVIGGIWDGNISEYQLSDENGLSLLVFVHCENIEIKNATIKNSYNGHLIAIEGVRNATISGCDLSGYKAYVDPTNKAEANEAIQLDIVHSEETCGNGAPFDDTVCDNIRIENNTIHDYVRGIGSHLSVEGLYHKNITIRNNTFQNIEQEAIKAFNYYNLLVTGNTIKSCGEGIRFYTKEIEGGKNYVTRNNGVAADTCVVGNDYKLSITSNNIQTIKQEKLGSGIRVLGSSERPIANAVVTSNVISDTRVDGMSIQYAPGILIQSNAITNVEVSGIEMIASQNAKIDSNKVNNGSKGENGIVLYNESTNVTISANTVSNTKGNGIALYKSNSANVTGNNVNTVAQHGIFSNQSNYTSIQSNTIANASENGVRVADGMRVTVSSNTIKNGKVGISLSKASSTSVKQNKITNTKKSGIGVYDGSNQSKIEKNTVTSPDEHGIILTNVLGVTVTGNKISDVVKNGITLGKTTKAVVSSNTIKSGKGHGISLSSATSTKIQKNTITSPKQQGITVGKSKKTTITGNKITKPGKNAINLYDKSNSSTVTGNVILSPKQHGISINSSSSIKCENNTITKVGGTGIAVNNGTNTILNKNKITESKKNGITLQKGAGSKVSSNKITKGATGIYVGQSDKAKILKNTITTTVANGITVEKSKSVSCDSNKVSKAKNNGISFKGGSKGKIQKNTVSNCKGHGIILQSQKNTTIQSNKCSKNKKYKIMVIKSPGCNTGNVK